MVEVRRLWEGRGRTRVNKSFEPVSPEERERCLQELQTGLEAHAGEFVLVVSRKEYFPRSHDDDWSQMRTDFHLGIIAPPFVENKSSDGLFGLSTENDHAYASDGSRIVSLRASLGPLTPMIHTERFGEKINGFPALEIVVGDEAVATWFANYAQWHRLEEIGERGVVESWKDTNAEGYKRWKAQYFDKDILLTFQRLQAALGRRIDLRGEVGEKLREELKRSKEQVLDRLGGFITKEDDLLRKLAAVRNVKLPRIGFPLDDASYEREVQQDEKDIQWPRSIPVNEEMRGVRAHIASELKLALELNMHKEPWTIIQNPKPGVKVKIDVPALINGYCARYRIQISD